MVQIRLLGAVTATSDGGAHLELGTAKCRAVLAALALSVGEAVPVTRLVELVWGESAPRTAEKTLQGYIADLRRALGPEAIARVGSAYRLDLPAEAVDAVRFRRQLANGEVDAALTTWGGTPMAGLDVPGLSPAVDGLLEQWLGALEDDLGRRVETDPPAAVATLTQLTADHPFRERLWALLMTALYRSGRQADALAAYQRARRHLVTELGVEPGPQLQQVQREVLEHGDVTDQGEPPPSTITATNHTTLPAPPTRLFGRDDDLDTVLTALDSSPSVTLVGPGGIGKTSLALAAAHRWQTGGGQRVVLVELAEITGDEQVVRAVADELGIVEGAGQTLTGSVVSALGSRPTLLVLDNCEHVIEAAAVLARAVADRAPQARVLATSRERLGVPGERLVDVRPLAAAGAALELFTERARAVGTHVDLAQGREVAVTICRELDGVPLAIELAAARTRSLSPAQLLARLDERFRLLTGGHRAGADRHRTLLATVEWSYELLSPAEQLLLARLAVFTGPFDLAAAEAVAASDELDAVDVADLLGALVDQSMVVSEVHRTGRRFRLLETLRQFAAEQLTVRGDPGEVARRHAHWCRAEVARIGERLTGRGEVDGVRHLGELWPNLRTALVWARASGDLSLADALVRPIAVEVNLRRHAEISDWAEQILELTPAGEEAQQVFWLLWATDRHVQRGDEAGYERLIAQYGHADHPVIQYTHAYLYDDGEPGLAAALAAVTWLREQGEEHAANLVEVAGVGSYMMGMGRFTELDDLAAQMRQRYERGGPPTLLYFAIGLLGYSAQFQGRHEQAARYFTESGSIEVPHGTFLINRTVEARIAFDQGRQRRALQMLREHVDDVLDTDYLDVARMVAMEFIYMSAQLDRLEAAARVLTFLDSTGAFGQLVRTTLLAGAVEQIAAAGADSGEAAPLDAREALFYMRQVLGELVGDPHVRT